MAIVVQQQRITPNATVAQWIRASGFYPAGRGFESLRSHQEFSRSETHEVIYFPKPKLD
jgi:hypothetical protein